MKQVSFDTYNSFQEFTGREGLKPILLNDFIVESNPVSTLIIEEKQVIFAFQSEKLLKFSAWVRDESIWVGCCSNVWCVAGTEISAHAKLNSSVLGFVEDESRCSVCVILDYGVACFTSEGLCTWERTFDSLIYDYSLVNDCVVLQTESGSIDVSLDYSLMEFSSLSELMSFLDGKKGECSVVLLEDNYLYKKDFFAIQISRERFVIGMIAESAIKPQCKVLEKSVFLGINREVLCFRNESIVQRFKSSSEFFEFAHLSKRDDIVVAIFETGILCLNSNASVLFEKQFSEIICGYEVVPNGIKLKFETMETEVIF